MNCSHNLSSANDDLLFYVQQPALFFLRQSDLQALSVLLVLNIPKLVPFRLSESDIIAFHVQKSTTVGSVILYWPSFAQNEMQVLQYIGEIY